MTEKHTADDTKLLKALHYVDDGRDYSYRIVWEMNSRRRISEKRFELPPACPQVVKPTLVPKSKPRRRKVRKQTESDF
ncbi:hypothetical protein [Trabulsiella odontotermitis]|uniref:hypothetical protein n=1 Tax=Trabulsiella odontotermitis TaxID=379893 RepID=UPI000675BEBA|nr:hypothetical protein [Trabulsiella odontotermitis]